MNMRVKLSESNLRGYFLAVTVGLVVARLFAPSEPPSAGEGIGFVMLWLIVATVWSTLTWRTKANGPRLTRVEWLLLFLTVWYVLAGLWGIVHGCPRAVINSMCEWIGIVVVFLLLHQLLRTAGECRALLVVFLGVAAGFALYGVYQYYWEFPALEASFRQDPSRFLQEAGIYLPSGSREASLFHARLRSGEPLATFALTNSLAGFLSAWFIVGLGIALSGLRYIRGITSQGFRRPETQPTGRKEVFRTTPGNLTQGEPPREWQGLLGSGLLGLRQVFFQAGWKSWLFLGTVGVFLGLIAWVVVLTRSRSAYLATSLGGILFIWHTFGQHGSILKKAEAEGCELRSRKFWLPKSVRGGWFWPALGTFVGVMLLGVLAFFRLQHPGGHSFINDALTSLQFRFQYWASTLKMIADMPFLGCGPGNFQIYYTRSMLPEASEVISDPHNFLLELVAVGGIPAGILLVSLLGAIFFPVSRRKPRNGVMPLATFSTLRGPEEYEGGPQKDLKIQDKQGQVGGSTPSEKGRGQTSPHKRGFGAKKCVGADNRGDSPQQGQEDIFAVIAGAVGGVLLAWPLGLLSSVPPSWIGISLTGLTLFLILWISKDWLLEGQVESGWLKIACAGLLVHLSASGGITFANVAGSFWILVAVALTLENLLRGLGQIQPGGTGSSVQETRRSKIRLWRPRWAAALQSRWDMMIAAHRGRGTALERIKVVKRETPRWARPAVPFLLLGLCVLCYFAAYRPVLGARSVWARIHREGSRGSLEQLLQLVETAAARDPLSPETFLALIQGYATQWAATGSPRAEGAFRQNVGWFLRISGRSAKAWEVVGDLFWDVGSSLNRKDCWEEAVEAWRQAVQNFPTNALLRAKLARGLSAIGRKDEAVPEARKALELNRRNPHEDRKLPPDLQEEMEKLAAGTGGWDKILAEDL